MPLCSRINARNYHCIHSSKYIHVAAVTLQGYAYTIAPTLQVTHIPIYSRLKSMHTIAPILDYAYHKLQGYAYPFTHISRLYTPFFAHFEAINIYLFLTLQEAVQTFELYSEAMQSLVLIFQTYAKLCI